MKPDIGVEMYSVWKKFQYNRHYIIAWKNILLIVCLFSIFENFVDIQKQKAEFCVFNESSKTRWQLCRFCKCLLFHSTSTCHSIDFTLFTFRCHYIMVARYFFEITKRGPKRANFKRYGFLGKFEQKV